MKSKQQRRAEAIRSSERHARESMRALGATEAHWRDAELHAINAWPGQAEDFGASPKAMAFVRSMWCEWLREDRNPAMKFAHGVARAAAGYPIDLHLSSSHETAEQESFNAFGSEPFDVQAEARNTLRTSAAWAVIAAIDGFNDIESESVTALVRSSIVAPVCGDDDTAQHVLTARVARFARELRPALNLPDLAGRTLFGRVGPDAASARMPIAARYVLDSLEAEVWPWDAALADALRALGRNGAEAATAILERSRQRMASAREAVPVRMPTLHMQALGFDSPPWDNRGDMLAQWVTADVGGHPLGMPWVSLVAWALWHDKVRPGLEKRSSAVPLKLPNYMGTGYARMSVIAAPLGEFVGGEGKDDGAYITQLEPGNGFVEIPEELLGRPVYASSAAVLAFKGDKRRSRQAAFSFTDERASDAHGVIDALASCQLDLTAGKLAAIALADKMSRGGGIILDSPDRWVDILLGERFDASGALVARTIRRSDDRKALAEALAQLDSFMLLLPGSAYARAFVVQSFHPERVAGDTRVGVGCSPSFLEVDPRVEGKEKGTPGGMLVDLKRLLAHSGNEGPRHFRVQLALSSLWNRAHTPRGAYDPSKLAFMSDLELARESNALSMQSIATLEGSASDAARLRKDRKCMRDSLARLQAIGIVGEVQERKRRGKAESEYRVHPPQAYSEARARGVDARLAQPEKGPAK